MRFYKLKKWLKEVRWGNEKVLFSNCVEIEYETDEDQFSFDIEFNYKKDEYECSGSIYHASEDNNAENVEAHTDEVFYHNKKLKKLLDEIKEEYGEEFIVELKKAIKEL